MEELNKELWKARNQRDKLEIKLYNLIVQTSSEDNGQDIIITGSDGTKMYLQLSEENCKFNKTIIVSNFP